MNKIIIQGRITKELELKSFQFNNEQISKVEFSVAIHEGKDRPTTFLPCTAIGQTAKIISQYFKKGHLILIEGKIKVERWEDKKTNQNRSATKIQINQIHFCDSK